MQNVDLGFILDETGSVGRRNYQHMKLFVSDVVRHFNVSKDGTRVAVVSYNRAPRLNFNFLKHTSVEALSGGASGSGAIGALTYRGGGPTYTGKAIAAAKNMLFGKGSGARPLSAGVPRVVIVITDGKSHDRVPSAAKALRAMGTTVFAIGVAAATVAATSKTLLVSRSTST